MSQLELNFFATQPIIFCVFCFCCDVLSRTTGITRSAFGQSAARFKRDRNAHELPGAKLICCTTLTDSLPVHVVTCIV